MARGSYPCPCPRQCAEQMCGTDGYSWKFVELLGEQGYGYEYHSSDTLGEIRRRWGELSKGFLGGGVLQPFRQILIDFGRL